MRALTLSSNLDELVEVLIRRNELPAREGIDTSFLGFSEPILQFAVEMRYKPEERPRGRFFLA